MNGGVLTSVLVALIGLAGVLLVALINQRGNRKKLDAEVDHLRAQIRKLELENNRLEREVAGGVAERERIIYDSSKGDVGHDFRGEESPDFSGGKPVGARARGRLRPNKDGVLIIERANREGRFHAWLQHYSYDGTTRTSIPRNDLIIGQRSIRVSCQARVAGGAHTLRFVLKDMQAERWLVNRQEKVESGDWTNIDVYLKADPSVECVFRIDDEEVTDAPSSVHVRNLVLAEGTTQG